MNNPLPHCLLIVLIILHALTGAGQAREQHNQPILQLKDRNDEHLADYYTYWLQSYHDTINPFTADSAFIQGAFRKWTPHRTLNLGYVEKRIWLRVSARNSCTLPTAFLWSIYNFVDTVSLFKKDTAGIKALGQSSSHLVAANRLFPSRALSMPFVLQPQENAILYLCISHPSGNIYFPTDITTTEDFLKWEQLFLFDQHWSWLLGFYLFSFCFSLILYCFLRDRIYLWYSLYVLANTCFLLMEDGIDALILPQWLYDAAWYIGQYNFMLLSCAAGIMIMQLFIGQQKQMPRWNRIGILFTIACILFIAIQSLVIYLTYRHHQYATIHTLKKTADLIIALSLLFILLSLAKGILQGRRLCWYYAITFFFFAAGCTLFMLNHLGITNFNLVKPNALAWGLFFELLSLSILLTGRFRYTLQQVGKMQVQELQNKASLSARLILAQDDERKRLAAELHDGLGAKIMYIRLLLQRKQLRTLIEQSPLLKDYSQEIAQHLQSVQHDIRNLSHELMPADFAQKGLVTSLEDWISNINRSATIVLRSYLEARLDILPQDIQLVIFRIMTELTHNILRHANASEAMIQGLIDDQRIQLIAEDNGKGYNTNPSTTPTGIGMKNTRSRVEYLAGEIFIDSTPAGTTIIINIPNNYAAS
ncbi:hypothetical protein KTO58_09395 [Chitinophaga pendula]|uniref:sensor histidine kinase n=1 Tax=Chitinophaga TaxID=79328 RepID=UPI000BAEA7FD|nr:MULTISPECIES: 7TM diverse intracellular signaling domain-containing protein [Chitinophaga]ASZ12990.1 hypothetical protein CK934_19510 [Chitinophaga sp. MD30]UCJ09378.1 hypothetical protein KTO58_09395 [Chitinophaga pendula]